MSETVTEYLKRMDQTKLATRPLTLARLEAERACGDTDMVRRNFFIPAYQREYLTIIGKESGLSMAAVLRTIIDEWISDRLKGRDDIVF